MERKLFCFYLIFITVAVALPSKDWAPNGWTTESSHRSDWQKTEAKYSDSWKQAAGGDDSQGKGWVSSEGVNDSKTKAIPTSWQQVDRHHGGSVKSSGWTNVGQKTTSQDIANGFVVHHPIPNLNDWNQSPSSLESWNKQNADEFWPQDANKKSSSSSTAFWDKAVANAEEQWQQNQTPDVPKSSWDTKSAWEKSPDVSSSTSLWNKISSPSAWEKDALNDRESAAGYAATGPAQYAQESSISRWQAEPSNNNNGWQKNSPPADAWKKDSPPSTLYDTPAKWNNKPTSENSEWQKAPNGWDRSSDFKTWQKETNGWTDSSIGNVQKHPSLSGWQQGLTDVTTPKSWQEVSASNGWHKSSSTISNGWDKQD